jgi:hypothetical protein
MAKRACPHLRTTKVYVVSDGPGGGLKSDEKVKAEQNRTETGTRMNNDQSALLY